MDELSDMERKINELMGHEYRRDAEFRYMIVSTEIGDLGKYLTHDPVANPSARPHGSKEDEILAYGQAFIQLMALAELRDIGIETAVSKGLENWVEADWKKAQSRGALGLTGLSVYNGYVSGPAYVAITKAELESMPPGVILVTPFAKPDLVSYIDYVLAVVTDHGGRACHLANIARERSLVSIVGTVSATERIKTGDELIVDATGDIGIVQIHQPYK